MLTPEIFKGKARNTPGLSKYAQTTQYVTSNARLVSASLGLNSIVFPLSMVQYEDIDSDINIPSTFLNKFFFLSVLNII